MATLKTLKTRTSLLALAACFISFNAQGADELKVWIGSSVQQGIFKDQAKNFEEKTKIKLVLPGDPSKTNASRQLNDVVEGWANAAITSAPFTDWASAAKRDMKIPQEKMAMLTSRVLGSDKLALIVHKDVGVPSLSLEQVQSVLSGKIRNWKEVGGRDLPIVVLLANKTTTNEFIKKHVLNGAEFVAPATGITEYPDYFAKIAATPGSVGVVPAATTDARVQVIKTPAMGRPITLATLGKPTPQVEALINFIKNLDK